MVLFTRWAVSVAVTSLLGCGEATPAALPHAPLMGQAGSASTSSAAGAGSAGLSGGSVDPVGGASGSGGHGPGGEAIGGGGDAGAVAMDASEELYDPERVPRFDIELPGESIAALEREPDVYVRGSLRYGEERVADIGVRIKGEGSKRTLREKAAFKLKFDEFVSKQSFRGLRRLTLNNMVEDPTFLAERLAFHFYRSQGLPAPRCNSALVYVNGELFGVYANVETEDKAFLRRWFQSDDGNLYEEGQVDFEPGNEAKFDLETNEEANDRSDLTALIAALASAKPASFLADLDSQLDTAHFLAFTAAEAAVNQWDMYGYTVFYPNNFRLYRDPGRQKFVLLPWGMDMSMKPFRDSGKPHIDVFELAREGDRSGAKITAGRMFRGCVASPSCRETYAATVERIASALEGAGLRALAEKYHAQLAPHVESDPRKEYSAAQVAAAYQSLLKVIDERPAAMRASARN